MFSVFKGLGGKLFGSGVVTPKVIPDGLPMATFESISVLVKKEVGHINDDVIVQGSRVAGTVKPTFDILQLKWVLISLMY